MIYGSITNETTNVSGNVSLEKNMYPSVFDITRLFGACIEQDKPMRVIVDDEMISIAPDILRKTTIRLRYVR